MAIPQSTATTSSRLTMTRSGQEHGPCLRGSGGYPSSVGRAPEKRAEIRSDARLFPVRSKTADAVGDLAQRHRQRFSFGMTSVINARACGSGMMPWAAMRPTHLSIMACLVILGSVNAPLSKQ